MSSLFIIGNGFDLDHKLPSSYEDFRKYLLRKYPNAKGMSPSYMISSTILPNGGEEYDKEEVVSFLLDVISKAEGYGDWKDIESSLGKLDFEESFSQMSYLLDDDDDDNDVWKRVDRYESVARHFYHVTIKIKELFPNWIESISLTSVNPNMKFKKLIDKERDTFLTFNYTRVLEEIYYAENVFHIHGEQGGEIVLGHGENFPEDYENSYWGSEESLLKIHMDLKKDTKSIIASSKSFFDGLCNIDKIYSYGFSFSKVDLSI
ncbi:bacteriophage abortive infection AbiH family protein [Bacillus sp. BP-3]|uniref:bacteriophage abortive infection AbiH family protein n=1 Tax=Bacillus sp. BP-3 TaxID=3022773 RepID=UPI00232F85DF|nr:bacteriophage abortive infection AbiH family protein [Bacillus sp. BP-3]MDC2867321.1 bacteriophage abortive infection AbiH family protein [Bacillus sp. BP-3]